MHETLRPMVEEAAAAIATDGAAEAHGLHGSDDVRFIDIRALREEGAEGPRRGGRYT